MQPSSFHHNRRVSLFLPLAIVFRRKEPMKATCLRFQETGENGTSGKWECDLHGKSLRGHLLLHQSLSPRLLEVQPHGSGFLLGNGANEHSTSRDRGLCLWEKDNGWTCEPRGWGKAYNLSYLSGNSILPRVSITSQNQILSCSEGRSSQTGLWHETLCSF